MLELKRFSLKASPELWQGSIYQDTEGKWVLYKDVLNLLEQKYARRVINDALDRLEGVQDDPVDSLQLGIPYDSDTVLDHSTSYGEPPRVSDRETDTGEAQDTYDDEDTPDNRGDLDNY